MKKYLSILFLGGFTLTLLSFQQKKPKQKVSYSGTSYLAGGQYSGGKIPVKVFDSLMKLPLVSKDSAGVMHPVMGFTLTYAERGAYEDSTGKLQIMTDYYTAGSDRGLLPDYFVSNLKSRLKYGDTIFYNDILGRYDDSLRTRYSSAPIKLILTEK